MGDLDLPGEPDPATDGDLQPSEERLAGDVGASPPDVDRTAAAGPVPIPPDWSAAHQRAASGAGDASAGAPPG